MEFVSSNVGGGVEILRNDHFVALSGTLDFSGVSTTDNGLKIVKAGTPVKLGADGYVEDNSATATGILHYDVREDRPVGAILVHAFIDKKKAEASYGSAYSGVAIPMVDIR